MSAPIFREVKQGPQFLWDSGTGDPTFCRRGREGSLFISLAARERDSSLGGRYLNLKRNPSTSIEIFLKNSTRPRLAPTRYKSLFRD